MVVKKNKVVFILLFLVNLLFSSVAFFILPERFYYDSIVIVEDTYKEIGLFGSFPFAILFYKITLLKYLPYFLIAIIQYTILIFLLYKIGIPKNFHKINTKNILTYIGFFLLSIYASMPSKEFITFLIVCLVPFIFNLKSKSDKFKIVTGILVFLVFSFFRSYYGLIPVIAIGMYLVSYVKLKNKSFKIVLYGIIISIFISFSSGIISGKYITNSTREQLNEERKSLNVKDANSMLVSPVEPTTWYGESVSIFYGFFAVNLPLYEGIKHIIKPQIVFFVIWQFMVIYILIFRLSKCLKDKQKYKFELWALLLLLSYYILQGLFEPDLGSAIKHKVGFFPLIYYIFYYESNRKEIWKNN